MSEHDAEAPRHDALTVRDNPGISRYEAVLDGAVAGFSQYERHDGLITFLHTEVDEAHAGHGIGGAIVRESLDDVRARGLTVRPLCPFYKAFLDEYPDYADLLA